MSDPLSRIQKREVDLDGRRVVLLDLPRVDPEALSQLRDLLQRESPDAVAVALDEQRREWLTDRESWESLNLLDILKQKRGRLLHSYLALRIFQKRFGSFDGCEPGDEMCVALEYAHQEGLPVHLVDRDVKTTGLRAWRLTPTLRRSRLALALTSGSFRRTRTRPETEEPDSLHDRLDKVGRSMPVARRVFVEERNEFTAQRIRESDAQHLAVVLSTTQAKAVADLLRADSDATADSPADLQHLMTVPERSLLSRAMPWLFSLFIVGLFVFGFTQGDADAMHDALVAWLLVNGTLTAIFTAAAMAHPAAVLAAAISAPFVSLNPAIGAGTVGALVQAFLVPPTIHDIERVGDDIARIRGWWTNRLARLALIFVFANLGSTVGTFVALALFPNLFGG